MKNKKPYRNVTIVLKNNSPVFYIDGKCVDTIGECTISWWEVDEKYGKRIVGERIKYE